MTGEHVATAGAVVTALARLGGYQPYRTAKPPGLKRLWEGYRRLEGMLVGYRAHPAHPKSNLPYV